MLASYWLLGLLLFLFCPRRCTPEQSLKAFFFSRETQLVIFFLFALFVGLNIKPRNYQVLNLL